MKAHVSELKKRNVAELKKLLTSYSTIGVADLRELPSKQLQLMKHNLKSKMKVFVTKKRLILLAINEIKDKKDLSKMEHYVKNSMPAIILSNEEPFDLYKELKKAKSKAPAKPGQKAPFDIIVHEGPTSFSPGPIIGELGALGIIAAVEGGKVCVKKEKVLAKQGETITQKISDALMKLKIEPMEIGMNMLAIIRGNEFYEKAVLDIDEEKVRKDLITACRNASFIAEAMAYITDSTIKPLVQKAWRSSIAISDKVGEKGVITSENIKKQLAQSEAEASAISEKIPQGEGN